jgi:hypothetical protein
MKSSPENSRPKLIASFPVKPKRRTLNVSIEVYNFIDRHYQSMEDTPDKILRRLLKIPTEKKSEDHE